MRFVLMQIAYPLGMALIVAAVTSLLVRRVLRGHRQIQAEESAALRDELAALADRIAAARS
ncbi:MAG: hypothetical protein KG028_14830 [Actinobacteria bacterium]|nr:hypothetical protein [Actinomycetota bacterium]